jgi:hypothetical protein
MTSSTSATRTADLNPPEYTSGHSASVALLHWSPGGAESSAKPNAIQDAKQRKALRVLTGKPTKPGKKTRETVIVEVAAGT